MANTIINTRIRLKYDTYENWKSSTLPLLPGEVAVCYIPEQSLDFNNKTALVMHKIGIAEEKTFSQLPWGSASAFIDQNGNNIVNTYATNAEFKRLDQEYIIVEDLTARNAIKMEDRIVGMRVYVKEIDSLYTWNGANWSQSFNKEELLNLFDKDYFFVNPEGMIAIKVDQVVTEGSKNVVTSGAVFTHVQNTVGIIETTLSKI